MNPVIRFEMPLEDHQRVVTFYSEVFGWQTQLLGSDTGAYVLATTTRSDQHGHEKKPAINGGFFQKSEDMNARYPSVVIQVEDIHEHMRKVSNAGGEVLGEPVEIPGVGWYVAFIDTEGNRVSMLQPYH